MILSEGGYSRLMQIMHGEVPNVKTISIITAENPMGKKISSAENNTRNKKLASYLKQGNYGYIQIKGKYNDIENPFLIMNMGKSELQKLCKEFDQESVIHGTVDKNKGVEFSYIENNGTVSAKRNVVFNPSNPDRYYSEYKGRKFIIPFFDKAFEKSKMENGKLKDTPNTKTNELDTVAYVKSLKNNQIKNPDTGNMVKITTALGYDKNSKAYKSAVEYVKKYVKRHNSLKKQTAVAESILDTNLVNPNKLTYTINELKMYGNVGEIIECIQNINKLYENNGQDAYEYGGMSNWGRRGRMLNLVNELAVKIAEVN